jgi:hypothetical protein
VGGELEKKGDNQTMKSKTRGTTMPPANKSELMRQLANQLTTVFLVALLCLWLAVTRSGVSVPIQRMPWWCFVILSAFALFLWLFKGRKKIRTKRWWVSLCIALGFIWLTYFILGISFGSGFFTGLAIFMLTWAALLLLVLGLVATKWGTEGKLGKAITWIIKQREVYWPLSALVVFASIFLGWKMLRDAGVQDRWMTPLFLGGMLVFFAVWLVYLFTDHSGRNRD